jgi:hypothetical protein
VTPASGIGSGSVTWTINSQRTGTPRTTLVDLAGQTFTLTQRGCSYSVSPSGVSVGAAGASGQFALDTLYSCLWGPHSEYSWITAAYGPVTSPQGPGTVAYSVQRNPSRFPRTGFIEAGGQYFTVAQAGAIASDLDDDGSSDLVWQHDVTGDPALDAKIGAWFMHGDVQAGARLFDPAGEADLDWRLVSVADVDLDGYQDLLFRHATDGRLQFWQMRNWTRVATETILPALADPQLRVAGVADFNGDDRPDLLLQHEVTGDMMVWFLTYDGSFKVADSSYLRPPAVAPRWQIRGVGDLNADGYPDLVWQDTLAGGVAVWFLQRLADGTITYSDTRWLTQPVVSDLDWKIAAVVDLNRDHRADIVWQHQTGGWLAVWYMWDNVVIDTRFLSPNRTTDTRWRIVGPK